MLLMTQRMVTWLKINVEDVEKENKQLIHQCFFLETEECSLDDLSVIAAISHLAGETRQCGGIFHLPAYTFAVTIFLIHHHKTPIRSAIGQTCCAREILVSTPSARSDTVSYLSSLMFLFGTCARYPEGN